MKAGRGIGFRTSSFWKKRKRTTSPVVVLRDDSGNGGHGLIVVLSETLGTNDATHTPRETMATRLSQHTQRQRTRGVGEGGEGGGRGRQGKKTRDWGLLTYSFESVLIFFSLVGRASPPHKSRLKFETSA